MAVAPIGYVFAVLVLFQFATVKIAQGFYADPMQADLTASKAAVPSNAPAPTVKPTGAPIHLIIPSIHVDAVVESTGLLPDGSMGIPKLPYDAAWYKLGPQPGDTGSAVIDGHVNWWYGQTGVFAHLNALKKGAIVTVKDDKGVSTSFVVTGSHAFGRSDDDTNVFQSSDGKAHLNLVTCTGVWQKSVEQYTQRLVVFTDKLTN